ncbi:lipid particle protein [Guyanagaster necrorhizus]|uniref:Lipid particle protein n=1 Tax=Guyanagaster necrorhizus TaxID=856835 RepID=A0A9P7VS15_9AGAR|nr:lipid particle protein [Guyanagaster necrorhizus MCA 3950]KAG7444914.1 lipid particle protein [Guyanagaster necrorhizus MCA 3950]
MSSYHLLVLVHGMWGNPSHMAELKRIMLETHVQPSSEAIEMRLLVAETNKEASTYDGIDWGGERVAQEVLDQVDKLQQDGGKVVRFSITGYSLGGLVSRYVVGILHQRGFFQDVTPFNFNTIATPHVGLPTYPSFLSILFSTLGPRLLSRTGEQFYCVDKWSTTGRPLLDIMADPDQIFYKSLAAFKTLRIYANSVNDRTVPYVTAAIELEDNFLDHATNGIEIELLEGYNPIIKSYALPAVSPIPSSKPAILSKQWLKDKKQRIYLPPFLQFRFPFNLVFYVFLPILIPIGVSLVIIRLSLASRSSRARIRLLEKENESNSERLIHLLSDLERQVEDAVADVIDDPGTTSSSKNILPEKGKRKTSTSSEPKAMLSPLQQELVHSLNTLPIKKELVYLDIGHNSHATIISRDIKRFEIHRLGQGVIKHWADSFVL